MIYQQKPPLGRVLNRKHPVAKGLVGCWVFNEKTGNTVFDLSGNGNHGTNNGADWVPEGLDFNGTSDYIDYFTSPTYTNFSFSTWVYQNDTTIGTLINGTGICNYVVVNEVANKFSVYDGNSWRRAEGVVTGIFNHLVFTFNGATKQLDLFVNGVHSYGGALGSYINGSFTGLGLDHWYLDGIVANAYVYDRTLQPSEVSYLYKKSYCMFHPAINPALFYYETPVGGNWFLLPSQNKLQGMRGING